MKRSIRDLRHALTSGEELRRRLRGRHPAIFLDYDGTLTPIVDRPEDALISAGMRDAVRDLAGRCPVCVVSGRDRRVVQDLMVLDDLIVAGSHGFDIYSPEGGEIQHSLGDDFGGLLDEIKARLREEAAPFDGAVIEEKSAAVAVHYRLVAEDERPRIKEIVDAVLAEHPDELKVTLGKMVYEIQPKIDWDKGKAVLYLLEALNLDHDDVVPLYLGDDVTDEDAFEALTVRGIGIFVGRPDDPELAGRSTAADYVLDEIEEVESFLNGLASVSDRSPAPRGGTDA